MDFTSNVPFGQVLIAWLQWRKSDGLQMNHPALSGLTQSSGERHSN